MAIERVVAQGDDTAVDANRRRGAGDEEQVARAPDLQLREPAVEPRQIDGVRKSVIINYVTSEWRAREQLAFPNAPIA